MGYGESPAKVSVSATVLAFFFYVMAFGLSVAAERRKSTASVRYDGMQFFCEYRANVSTGLAGFAFVFLAMAHLVVMGLTRCLCCGGSHKPGTSRVCLVIAFVLCWICWFIAEVCLLVGASRNSLHTRTKEQTSAFTCEQIQKGVFASGAAFALFSGILGIAYYLQFVRTLDDMRASLPKQVDMAAHPHPGSYGV